MITLERLVALRDQYLQLARLEIDEFGVTSKLQCYGAFWEQSMNNRIECNSIEEVRANIDRIDRQIVTLLAERGGFVQQAARFKKTTDDVKAPQRVEQVIAKVTALSQALGANPSVTEQVYRAMIAGFIDAELAEHASISTTNAKP